ncbi:MAG: hypothetical protein K2I78_00055 [Clostridia bacterium]|nr:hypothetical protein [Clostridia bacterium]MDE7215834.1 hypothetical protein [Clostridia bacterium]
MKKYGKTYLVASTVNAIALVAEWICFAIWTAFAVKSGRTRNIYYFLPAPAIFSAVVVATMIYNSKIASAGKSADSNVLQIAIFAVNAFDVILTNVYFAAVLGRVDIQIEKFLSLLLVGIFYLLDVMFFLMSKGYLNVLNNYYDVENDRQLGKIIGKTVGLSLLISNTLMLLLSIFIASFILTICVCPVNTIVIIISMVATESKYGKKNYL